MSPLFTIGFYWGQPPLGLILHLPLLTITQVHNCPIVTSYPPRRPNESERAFVSGASQTFRHWLSLDRKSNMNGTESKATMCYCTLPTPLSYQARKQNSRHACSSDCARRSPTNTCLALPLTPKLDPIPKPSWMPQLGLWLVECTCRVEKAGCSHPIGCCSCMAGSADPGSAGLSTPQET